jgi:formamidopyrimidine-DNA glycosylase
MPELPEVETIRFQLNRALKGLTIRKVTVLSAKNFVGNPKALVGQKITGVDRWAKMILIWLGNGHCLAVHLKLTGQLIYAADQLPNKFTRVIIEFNDQSRLFFNDIRKFGWMKIVNRESLTTNRGFEKLGPEANDEKTFTLEYFAQILSRSRKPVKLVLLDQEKIAGVGNIYANEALFEAGILPTKPSEKLRNLEIKKLREAIVKVLNEAIKHQGTSDRDEAYRQITGEKGQHQNYLWVYGRAGQKCRKCGGLIKRIAIGGRGTFFCSACQK